MSRQNYVLKTSDAQSTHSEKLQTTLRARVVWSKRDGYEFLERFA